MNRGDWIQLSILILLFLILSAVIYTLLMHQWWMAMLEISIIIIIGYIVTRRIKL